MIQSATAMMRRYSHVNWALADQTMVSGVNFLTGILLARYLGIEEFGRFTLIWMVVLFVNSIHYAAIISPMMSIGPKQPEAEAQAYYGSVICQHILFSCAVFLLLFGGVRLSGVVFPDWRMEGLALPLAFAAFAFQSQELLRRYFFVRERAVAAFTNDVIRYLGQIAVLIWLFMFFRDAMDTAKVIWVIAIMSAFSTACGAFSVEPIKLNVTIFRAITSRHWHFSKWLVGSALMLWMTGNLFIIAAGALLGASAVGALRAAQNFMGLVHILFMGLDNIVPARAARHFHVEGKKALGNYLKRVTLYGGGATVAIGAIVSIVPELWLGLVFGTEYEGYGYLLQVFAVFYVLVFLSLPITAGLKAMEQSRTIFLSQKWSAIFSVLAAYSLTKHFGLAGVMTGLVMASLIRALTQWYGLKKMLN